MDNNHELKAENFAIFPTLVTKGHIPKSLYDKEIMKDIIMENVDEEGQTMDFIGEGAFIHHDARLTVIYEVVTEYIKHHLSLFALDPDEYQVHVVKSWFNVNSKDHSNAMHAHPEADYSATFYPNVPADSKKWLRLVRGFNREANELFPGMYYNGAYEKNANNANEWTILPEEGDVIIFPSAINHDTVNEDLSESSTDVQKITTRDSLDNMRICIGIDVKITARNKTTNHHILQPVYTWRTFS